MHPTALDFLKLWDMKVFDVLPKWKIFQNVVWNVYSFYAGVTIGTEFCWGGEICVVKDLRTTTMHAVFHLSSRFAVASWFRNGLMGDETNLHLCLVTGEVHYNVSMWLDLILTGEYLYSVVEGMIDGVGPQNKMHMEVSLGLISGHYFLIMYMWALSANSLVFSCGAVLLYCALLSTTITGMQVPRATYLGVSTRNVENIHSQNIIGIANYFLILLL